MNLNLNAVLLMTVVAVVSEYYQANAIPLRWENESIGMLNSEAKDNNIAGSDQKRSVSARYFQNLIDRYSKLQKLSGVSKRSSARYIQGLIDRYSKQLQRQSQDRRSETKRNMMTQKQMERFVDDYIDGVYNKVQGQVQIYSTLSGNKSLTKKRTNYFQKILDRYSKNPPTKALATKRKLATDYYHDLFERYGKGLPKSVGSKRRMSGRYLENFVRNNLKY